MEKWIIRFARDVMTRDRFHEYLACFAVPEIFLVELEQRFAAHNTSI